MGLSGGSWQSALPLGMAAGEKEWKTPQLHCHHLRVGWLWPQENRTRAVHPCTQTDHLQHPCNTMRMPLPGLVAFGAEHCGLTKFPVRVLAALRCCSRKGPRDAHSCHLAIHVFASQSSSSACHLMIAGPSCQSFAVVICCKKSLKVAVCTGL